MSGPGRCIGGCSPAAARGNRGPGRRFGGMNGRRPPRPATAGRAGAWPCEGVFWDRSRHWRREPASAWGQAPAPIAPAGQPIAAMAGGVIPASGPAPVIMPPIAVGPPGDPHGSRSERRASGRLRVRCTPIPDRTAHRCSSRLRAAGGGGSAVTAVHRGGGSTANTCFGSPRGSRSTSRLLTTSAPTANGILGQPSTTELVPARDLSYSGDQRLPAQ